MDLAQSFPRLFNEQRFRDSFLAPDCGALPYYTNGHLSTFLRQQYFRELDAWL